MDEKKKWIKKVKNGKKKYSVDLVETLYLNLNIY